MKKKSLIIISLILYLITLNVQALTYDEIKNRHECDNFEVAVVGDKQSLEKVACFDTYKEANEAFLEDESEKTVILERKNEVTRFINAKLALVYLGVKPSSENTNYYSNKNLTGYITYMNHHPNYGATDGVFLDFNYDNHAIKVKTSGVVGWVADGAYQIVPLGFNLHSSYYKVTDAEILHYYSSNITKSSSQSSRAIDKKPSMLDKGEYYSYDGNYFYKDLKSMIKDYKNDTYDNAVNKDTPYYNYYMYLPHRTKTNYTSDDIDNFFEDTKGFKGTIYGRKYTSNYSNLFGTGAYFKTNENLYGANAISMMSLAINESASGTSAIAAAKNNLFGHQAYDASAFDSATGYVSPYQNIVDHANGYINCSYARPTDSRYHGSNLGNKTSGMNIAYASDAYWGEKAANYYYQFDKKNGYLDYNYYQLGLLLYYDVYARSNPNTTSPSPFMYKTKNVPLVILEEVKGEKVGDSDIWYKVMSDANLNSTRTSIQSCSKTNYYNWDNNYVYIHSSFVKKINNSTNNKLNNPKDINNYNNYKFEEYTTNKTYTPKVGLITNDTSTYNNPSLTIASDKKIKKGNLITVFMEAKENEKVVSYLVTTDYGKNQRRWISASNLTFSDKDILKVSLIKEGSYLNVYKTPGKDVLGAIYTDTYTVITDKTTYNNDTWLQIYYGVDNTLAWINTNISSSVGTLSYTTDKLNKAPSITASDKAIYLNDTFNPLDKVTAFDSEDGDLTKNIKVTKNTVNVTKPGTYEVTYEVVDSKGLKTTKTIKVTVKEYKEAKSLFIYDSIKQTNNDTFTFSGFLGVKQENNINMTHELISTAENTNKSYTFKMDKYENYPYDVSSLGDDKTYNYQGGWFKGNINLASLPDGNYKIEIVAYNKDTGNYAKTYFTNIAYQEMPRRVKTNTHGYAFDIDYSYSGSPIILAVRASGLISYDVPNTLDPMYNFFTELSVENDTLEIMGTSHSILESYSKNDTIKREIIFENTKNYQRYSYDLSYIDNGPYQVKLAVSDNKDKTRAWFKKDINLNLPKGTYAIILKTTSNNKSYYGELIDVSYTNFNDINTNKYEFKRIDDKRLRVELTVK